MKPLHCRFVSPVFLICVKAMFFFAGAQWIAPLVGNEGIAQAQIPSKPKPGSQTKSQKLANPLNDLLEEAQRAIDKNEFEAAIAPLQKVIAEQPKFAYAHFQLAYVYTALKKTDEARAEYERTIAIDPKISEAYLDLGILLLDKDPAAAVAPLGKAAEMLPAQSRPQFLLGIALERSGNQSSAVTSFENAALLDPRDFDTLLHLADAYLALNRAGNAETKFRSALELQPQDPRALFGLARSLETQKKAEAAEAYRKYLAVQPGDAAARSRLVHLLLESEQYDVILAELDRADAGKPTIESLKLRADIQIAQKKWDDSIVTLRQAIAMASNDARLHGGLGRTYLQIRDYPDAEKELKAAIQLDGENVDYWKDLSTAYYLSKNYAATLAVLDRVDQFETPGAGSWFIRALCYDNLKQPAPALDAYQKFLDLDQNKNPDQVWQAQERSKVLRRMLDRKR
jgi:tetratricopeptide (TPR) repeat protein